MSDYEVTVPMCVRGESFFESDCGSQGYARALFVSWNILSMYIFVSMVCLAATFVSNVCKTNIISSSPLSSKVSVMSISALEVRRQYLEQKSEGLKRRGKSSIQKAQDIFPKKNFRGYWG